MTAPLPLLTDDELGQTQPTDDEAGFGALTTERGPLPLKAMDVRGRIDGLLAQVTVCQTFVNTHDAPLEATYIFPLPDRAAVTGFRMEVAGRVIEAVLEERAQARRAYDEAIEAGHRASIAEEERPGVFTIRVGNLMPGEQATVRLTLAGPLPYSHGEVTFRFPLVLAPRYIPGTPLPGPSVGDGVLPDTDAVPDASRISPPVLLPGFPNPVRLTFSVDLHDSVLPVGDVRSSLHAVRTAEEGGVLRVSLGPGERLDRDFVLRFRLGDDSVRTALSLHPDSALDASEGTFALTIVPPVAPERVIRPRDVAFVLDRSGSMGGWKMVAARRAMARMVDALTDRDRFQVYAFDDSIETPAALTSDGLVPASDRNRYRAVEFLAGISARGGTQMAPALERAITELSACSTEGDRCIVLVTDGQVGNEDQILRNLGTLAHGLRFFALGIDTAVNEGFLHRLAGLGAGGVCEVVESEERLDAVMDSIHRRIGAPLLSGLRLASLGLPIEPDSTVPSGCLNLFDGAPVLLLGRYRGALHGGLELRATDASGRTWSESIAPTLRDNPAIAAAWARGHIRELEDRYLIGTSDRESLERQIIATSLRFGVLCRFTAYVAVDTTETVNEGGRSHRITQPVETPAGWEMMHDQVIGYCSSARFVASDLRTRDALGALSSPTPDRSCVPSIVPLIASSDTGMWSTPPSAATRDCTQAEYELADLMMAGTASGRGVLGRWWDRARRRARNTPASVPKSPRGCRKLARKLLQQMAEAANGSIAVQLSCLFVLQRDLAPLIEGLKSRKVPGADLRALETLLAALMKLLAQDDPQRPEIATLWARAESHLKSIAIPQAGIDARQEASPDARRTGFWK